MSPRRVFVCLTVLLAAAGAAAVAARSSAADPDVQLRVGQFLASQGLYAEALDAFKVAEQSDSPSIRVPARKGIVHAAVRVAAFVHARETAEALKRERPGDSEVLSLHGDSMWAAGRFAEAESSYRDALALAPKDARALNGLARADAAKGRYPDALDRVRTALSINSRESEYHHTLSNIYQGLGRYDLAAESLSRFMNLLPLGARDDRLLLAATELRFLSTFGQRRPNEILGDPYQVHVIPFRVEHDKVIVSGRINGSREMDLVVDTGSEMAAITAPVAERQGVAPIVNTISAGVGSIGLRGLQLARIDRFEVGTLKVRNVPTLIKSPALTDLPRDEGEAFSPLAFGLSMSVDYKRQRLVLARSLPDSGPADVTMPLWMHRLATVQGFVDDNHPVSFVVDTGGQVISISAATALSLNRPAPSRRIALRVWGASGWDPDAYLLPGIRLDFADSVRYRDYSVVVLNLRAPSVLLGYELGGIVGHRFLSRYQVSFDLERAELRLNTPS